MNKEALLLKHASNDMIYEITVGYKSSSTGLGKGLYGFGIGIGSCRKLSPENLNLIALLSYYTESRLGSKRWHTTSNPYGRFTRLDTGRTITIQGTELVSDYDYFLGTEVGKKIKVKYEPL